jgi:hypothetical protein
LDAKLAYCFKPMFREYGPVVARITKSLATLHPTVHIATVAAEIGAEIAPMRRLLGEHIAYFRGDWRRGGGGGNSI